MPLRTRRKALGALAALPAAWAAWPLPAQAQNQPQPQPQPWPEGRPVPPLVAPDIDDRTWDLAALRGRAVVVNFWATWCPPCTEEMPSLNTLADLESDWLTVLAVNTREPLPTAERYVRRTRMDAIVTLSDPRCDISKKDWAIKLLPTTVLIDTAGRPQQLVTGAVDWTGPQALGWIERLRV
ncbi:TlpA family protein disulfide reductase [Ottowia sp.]|uniref:TlpA family protein disulfide reductase n=1 Tax=Ottowia sp. TaxID=1898956 RepID=UPI003A8C6C77